MLSGQCIVSIPATMTTPFLGPLLQPWSSQGQKPADIYQRSHPVHLFVECFL